MTMQNRFPQSTTFKHLQEIAMLKQLSFDRNVLQYYGAFEVCGTPVLVIQMGKIPFCAVCWSRFCY